MLTVNPFPHLAKLTDLVHLTCLIILNCHSNIICAWFTYFRYLSYIMDVVTPTNDCLSLVYDLLLPVIMKGNPNNTLNHEEVM